jgi:hypothetical protein
MVIIDNPLVYRVKAEIETGWDDTTVGGLNRCVVKYGNWNPVTLVCDISGASIVQTAGVADVFWSGQRCSIDCIDGPDE